MKLYVLVGGWDWEGYDYPVGVFSTKKLAEKAKSAACKGPCNGYDRMAIVEYTLDESGIERKYRRAA